jgi:hypothetical protein
MAAALVTVLAAPVMAAPAHADTTDTSFLSALNNAGIGYDNPDLTAELGKSVCPMLVEPGKNFASVASTVANNGVSPGVASFFTGIAISMYCPQMMGDIGNGNFLNSLQGLQGLQGIAGVPTIPGLR